MNEKRQLTYVAVTPARDEEENLARLGLALMAQTLKPVRWVIVENGSTDGTLEIARRFAATHAWVKVIQTEPASAYQRTSAYMRAFHAGLEALDGLGDLVVKLDADVSMGASYFEGLIAAFAQDAELGIASGTLMEEHGGRWQEHLLLDDHCWGPTRTYRRACLDVVLPLEDHLWYSSVDETKAHLAGFGTRTLRGLPFRHHRPEGAGEGSGWKNWRVQGLAAYQMGYRPSYLIARCAYRLRADRAALGLVAGYVEGVLRQEPRYSEQPVVFALRERQRARRLPAAIRTRLRRVEPA